MFFRKVKRIKEIPAGENNLTKSKIFSDVIIENNRRLFIVIVSIVALANIAVTIIKAVGIGSKYLEYGDILIEIIIISVLLSVTVLASNSFKGRVASGYIMITGVTLCCAVFEYTFYGADQLFASRYIPLALSIFYFNPNISIYSLVLILITQTVMLIIRPELRISGPGSNTAVRYLVYLMTGIGAFFGARATRELLKFAISQHNDAAGNLYNLRGIAKAVMKSLDIMKKEAAEHGVITSNMNDISQHQAASLEEITTALEELAANSHSISEVARSLYEELAITVESVNDLKTVNDKVQESSHEMNRSLNEVNEYSRTTADQIKTTENKFNTVKNRSSEMANFVQVINDIADKVNLLSLNAAIEAARAGDYGRGFAVVADEISKLADATSRNAKEIENIIRENLTLIDESGGLIVMAVETMSKLNSAIVIIRDEVKELGKLISDIDMTIKTIKNLNLKIHESGKNIEHSTAEQKIATDESTRTVFDIAQKSQEIVTIAISLARSTETMNDITAELDRLIKDMAT